VLLRDTTSFNFFGEKDLFPFPQIATDSFDNAEDYGVVLNRLKASL
jgi:hypothetical protein